MPATDRPTLQDWSRLSGAVGDAIKTHEHKKTQQQRRKYYDQKTRSMQQEQQVGQETADIVNKIASGADEEEVFAGDYNPQAKNAARVKVAELRQQQYETSEAGKQALAEAAKAKVDQLQGLTTDAAMALDSGNTEAVNDLAVSFFNNAYNNQLVSREKGDDDKDKIVLEDSLTGDTQTYLDDLDPAEKVAMMAKYSQDPETVIGDIVKQRKKRRQHNTKAFANAELVMPEDGNKKLWEVRGVVDPVTGKRNTYYYNERPSRDSQPVAIKGPTKLYDTQEMEAIQSIQEGRQANIPTLSKNQTLDTIKDFYFEGGGIMGETQARMNHAQPRYEATTEEFERLMKEYPQRNPLTNAHMARHSLEKTEDKMVSAVAQHPDQAEAIKQKFKKQFGYLPTEKLANTEND